MVSHSNTLILTLTLTLTLTLKLTVTLTLTLTLTLTSSSVASRGALRFTTDLPAAAASSRSFLITLHFDLWWT